MGFNDAFNNNSNVDDFYWNCEDCTELYSIISIDDNNSSNGNIRYKPLLYFL